jgi:hypothetical protein
MSTLAYAAITSQREGAESGTSTTTQKPGVKTFVDLLAALVPAEVLAAHAVLVDLTTKTKKLPGGGTGLTIVDPATLEVWGFWALLITSALLYLFGHIRNYGLWDVVRNLIPPIAFVLWTMGQKTTAFNAAFPEVGMNTRYAATIVGALLIGAIATALAYKADADPSTNEAKEDPPPAEVDADPIAR